MSIPEVFRHFNEDHPDFNSFSCSFSGCLSSFTSMKSFKNHFYRIHSGAAMMFNHLFDNIGPDSFFSFFTGNCFINQNDRVDISCIHSPPDLSHSLSNLHEVSDSTDYRMVKELGKIAFKFSYSNSFCKSNTIKFFSEILKFISSNNVSNSVLKYASEVFLSEDRVSKYFFDNFILFSFDVYDFDFGSIYYTNLSNAFNKIFELTDIMDNLIFGKVNSKDFFLLQDSFEFDSTSQTIFLAIYFDDFNPLVNSLSNSSGEYKVTAVYLKILNLKPLYLSKRNLIVPFALFYSKISCNENSLEIYNFIVSELNKLIINGCNETSVNFRVKFFVGDNLAANEIC